MKHLFNWWTDQSPRLVNLGTALCGLILVDGVVDICGLMQRGWRNNVKSAKFHPIVYVDAAS